MDTNQRVGHRPSLTSSVISFGEVLTPQRTPRTSLRSNTQKPAKNLEQCSGHERRRVNGCFHSYRFIIAQLGGLAAGLMLFSRYSMSIAILPMVNQTHLYLEEHPNKTLQDFLDEGFVPSGEFNWNNEIIAIILGWYMFTYTLPQTLAAKLNLTIGCRLAIPMGLLLCAISNVLTPSAAYLGWRWVVACRLLNGLGSSGILPGMITLLENWLRYDEISSGLTTGTFVFAAICVLCPLASGYLAAIHWSVVFYALGCVMLVFCIIWFIFVTDRPHSNWLVSERELAYLSEQQSKGEAEPSEHPSEQAANKLEDNSSESLDYKPDSWLEILKLPAFYAYLVTWAIYCISSCAFTFILPIYMRQFLKIPISENGFYCAIIQTGYLLAVLWPHQLLRWLLSMNLTITQARNISQGICALMMAGTFIFVGIYHEYQLLMFFLNRCALTGDVIVAGSVMSNFAKAGMSSLLYATINTVGYLSLTSATPLIGRWLDYTGSSPWGWKMLFFALGLCQVVSFFIFSLFIDSEPIKFKNKSRKEPQISKVTKISSDGPEQPVSQTNHRD